MFTFAMMFSSSSVSLPETRQFSALFLDYVSGAKQLESFYKHGFQPASLGPAIADRISIETNRTALAESLRAQYADAGLTAPESLLERLQKTNCFTVCTGHQLGVATGPLFFLYKIITTIKLAEQLKKDFPEHDFLPVYWMASEDHDFGEIASIHLFGKTLRWTQYGQGAVGRLSPQSILPLLDELSQLAGESPAAQDLMKMLHDAYAAPSLAVATRRLVQALFSRYDLLILDADDKTLKQQLIPFAWDDLTAHIAEEKVTASAQALEKLGYEIQVNPRNINLFYLSGNSRERIVLDGDEYVVLNTNISFTRDSIREELENYPERFSPNVVLRPLYQQVILPNIAYVGGPGELAYWLEYRSFFESYKVPFPALVPRSFALLADKPSVDRLNKLELGIADLFEDPELLVREYVLKNSSGEISLQSEKEELRKIYNALAVKAESMDATLKKSVEAEMQKQINALDALEAKMLRAEKQKQETSVNQIRKTREKFLPGNSLQERYENFIPWYLRTNGELIPALYEALKPCGTELLVLTEQ